MFIYIHPYIYILTHSSKEKKSKWLIITSSAIMELHTKTTRKYNYTRTRMGKIKNAKHCQEGGITGTLTPPIVGILMCLVFLFGKQFGDFSS